MKKVLVVSIIALAIPFFAHAVEPTTTDRPPGERVAQKSRLPPTTPEDIKTETQTKAIETATAPTLLQPALEGPPPFDIKQDNTLERMDNSFWMDISFWIAIGSLFIAGYGVKTAKEALRSGEKARIHQVLVDVLFEYRSAQMLLAIRTLWSFYDKHKEDVGKAYNDILDKEEREISRLAPELRLEREKTTLHYQRRLVGQFYSLLAGLYELQIIPAKTLYTYWAKTDLQIIPLIIIPIGRALSKRLGTTSDDEHANIARMQKLYNDCPSGKLGQLRT
jgi:hypothetical protein